MNPPVSNGVQGGYLVAIFFTGAIFGGIALVFKEITDGLGCFLGGFCVGMWLLTLKSGGLVINGGAKVGLVVAFAVAFYCLSFSNNTRSYGLILCTAFSGATAAVLGIDCFSRAGLKEFWLYIWGKALPYLKRVYMKLISLLGLNDDMFPLNTYTYPVTRGMKVEIAVIVVVTVFGAIAQLRLWRFVKERRVKEEDSRQEIERKMDEVETEVGRQLERNNLRDRAEWEHMYGNDQDAKAPSLSETAVADDSREDSDRYGLSTRGKGNSFKPKDMATVQQSTGTPDNGQPFENVKEVSPDDFGGDYVVQTRQSDEEQTSQGEAGRNHEMPRPASFISQSPSNATSIIHDDDSEHGAVMGSEADTPRSSKRFSERSWMTRVSWRSGKGGLPISHSQSEEALVQNDVTSSVAGTVDDHESMASDLASLTSDARSDDELSAGKDAQISTYSDTKTLPQAAEAKVNGEGSQKRDPSEGAAEEATCRQHFREAESAQVQNNTVGDEHGENKAAELIESAEVNNHDESESKAPAVSEQEVGSIVQVSQIQDQPPVIDEVERPGNTRVGEPIKDQDELSETTPEVEMEGCCDPQDCVETATDSCQQSQTITQERSKRATLDAITVQSIPEQTLKVVHKFRTKEWAKHLADAEAPELQPLDIESEANEDSTEREAAAPVNIEGLLQTALNAHPPPIVNSREQHSPISESGRPRSYYPLTTSQGIMRAKSRNSLLDPTVPRSLQPLVRNASASSVPQQQDHINRASPMQRSTSAAFLTVTAPSSNAKSVEATDTPRWSGPPALLAVRENRLRNRLSSTSVRFDPWASRSQSRQSYNEPARVISPTLSIPEERGEDIEEAQVSAEDDDDLPLSKRRAMLQRQTMRSPSAASFQRHERAISPQWFPVESSRSFATMAAWRHSIREDILSKRDPLLYQASSSEPVSPERPRSLWGSMEQMRTASASKVDIAIAEGIQRGSMTDLHRQAMRRMQASANRQL